MRDILTHTELDRRLDPAATDPDRFEAIVDELVQELDSKHVDLEVKDPWSWRISGGKQTARHPSDALAQFRLEVEDILPLDREEEAQLARRIEFARRRLQAARVAAGLPVEPPDRPAADERLPRDVARRALELHQLRVEMVERNLYLVLINVERYAQNGVNRPDLIQEGSLALFRAVDGFEWRRGLLFRTYAVHWLNQAFRNYLYNFNHTVRVPVYLQKALKHIHQAILRLGDPNATAEEIAAGAKLSEGLVTSAMAAARTSYSIDAALTDGEESSRLRDLLVVDQEESEPYSSRLEGITLEEGVERALAQLSDPEREVVRMRFGLGVARPHTLAEVAKAMGVSVERVRQIQMRALAKMNTPGLRRELDPFLN